jgi:hypothetical protein
MWNDGMAIAGSTTIAAGTTVAVAAGAKITLAASAMITVNGTLLASDCATHASLTWAAGAGQGTGITVASGGTLKIDGVDIMGAGTALNVQGGGSAEYDDGTITSAVAPFQVASGGTLTTNGATVTGTRGTSSINGTIVATGLDYNSDGNSGIVGTDGTTMSFTNSKLHGNGPTADMLISGGVAGATITVKNTEIYMVHCAFHFQPVNTFTISYANLHDNAFGFMLYGSSPTLGGTMTYSNDVATSGEFGFSVAGTNGPITFDHDYIPDGVAGQGVAITNASTTSVSGTGAM